MDARKKKILLILCVASVILVWRIYAFVYKYFPSPAQADAAQQMAPADILGSTSSQDDAESQALIEAQMRIAKQDWGHNPFDDVPWATHSGNQKNIQLVRSSDGPAAPKFRLTGVSLSGDQWLAAFEGRIVRVGDVVAVLKNKYQVIDITRHSVTLAAGGWSFRYELGSSEVVVQRRAEGP